MSKEKEKSIMLSKEICKAINTNDFETTILKIIEFIKLNNIDISSCDCFSESKTEIDKTGENIPHIRLKLNKKIIKPEHIIWNMLHEFGHALSGVTEKTNIYREIEAWSRAYYELLKYPELKILEQSFFKYQKDCL